jgi:ketosteroid isomerase-like protein
VEFWTIVTTSVSYKEAISWSAKRMKKSPFAVSLRTGHPAVRARDINGVIAHHTDDVLMYDVPPPTAVRGISAYRETWPPFFKALAEGGAAFDIVELQITAGDTVGFATALLRCGSKEVLAKDPAPRLRLTIGLRKVDGAWNIAHEHHSFPTAQE